MAKIGVISLGCAKNQVNCEQMMYRLQEAGHEILPDVTGADVVLINTCGFIDSAKSEAIDHIIAMGQLKEAGVVGKILVTGCLSQRYQKEILEEMPEVDGLLGTGSYGDVVPAVEALLEGKPVASFGDIHQPEVETGRVLTTPQHYAYLKIAEGCDNHCAYCVIPSLRGRYRSRQMDDVLYEARNLAADGVKELIVVAQDITRYGLDLYGRRTLAQLLPKLCAIEGIQWVRLHYLYPDEITDELIDVIAREPKIVKYLDIPIQHISDRVLRAMHRRGTGQEIRTLFRKLRERIPGLVLRTSLIAGFPGETEEEFEELCEFLLAFRVERAGVFPYSPEPGSAAAAFPDQVDEDVKRRRVELLTDLQMRIVDDYCAAMVGKVLTVLCEGYDEETELFFGRGEADSPGIDGLIHFEGEEGGVRPGEFYSVKITNTYDGELVGVLYEEEEA